jgi:hypothetical protein
VLPEDLVVVEQLYHQVVQLMVVQETHLHLVHLKEMQVEEVDLLQVTYQQEVVVELVEQEHVELHLVQEMAELVVLEYQVLLQDLMFHTQVVEVEQEKM